MIAPPLTAERLLEGLSARTDFRDGILGDLAEEYAERVESAGEVAARRWYNREAARAAPHLLLDWARSLRMREIRRVVNVLFAAYFLVSILVTLLMFMARGALESVGIASGFLVISPSGAFPVLRLALGAIYAVLAGYVAASLDKKTPFASAIALGVVWAGAGIALSFTVDTGYGIWNQLAASILMIAGTTVGGMLQIRNARFNATEA